MADYFEYIVGKDERQRLVRDTEAVHQDAVVPEFQAYADNQHVPSEKLVKDSLDALRTEVNTALNNIDLPAKEDVANKVVSFQATPDNQHYPSEKLVYDTLFALHQTISGETAAAIAAIDVTSTVVVESLDAVLEPDEGIDYIVKNGNSYLFYKYIGDEWKMIGGAMAFVGKDLPETGDSFTDYYIATGTENVYLHYRWIDNAAEANGGHFISVGSDSYGKDEVYTKDQVYSKEEVEARLGTVSSAHNSDMENVNQQIGQLGRTIESTAQSISGIEDEIKSYTANLVQEGDNYVYQLIENESEVVSSFTLPATGGGGSGAPSTTLVVERITASPLFITPSDKAVIEINYSSVDSDGQTIDGTYVLKNGSTVIMSGSLIQGRNSFDVTDYCSGTQKFTLTVTDEGGSVNVKSWTVQLIDIRLESNFNDTIAYSIGQAVNFSYIPYGSVAKTVHFKLDGVELGTVVTSSSGLQQTYSVPAQRHGAHLLECWITATVNNVDVETDHIFKDIVWYDEDRDDPVIGCKYRFEHYGLVAARQYNTVSIPYVVYDPRTISPTVEISVNGGAPTELHLTSATNTWSYKPSVVGTDVLTIKCRTTTITIKLNVEELGYDIEPITANLNFDFNPVGLNNASADRLWKDTNNEGVSLSVSDNFDWNNGGYQTDENGDTYFCVKSGTRAYISHNLFGVDPKVTGAEFKVIFRTTNVQEKDAAFLTCLSEATNDNAGLEMRVHEARVFTSADELLTHYSEEDIIEFEYNINGIDQEDVNSTSFVMSYEDGVAARPLIYSNDSGYLLHQLNPVPITIGSDKCDVHIYRMKSYSAALSDTDILANFIADSRDSDTMISRYERNQIYNENNELTPESVANACPDLRVIMIECPHFTNDKKDYVKDTTVRCIYKNGDPALDNWTFANGYHAGQGTSSNKYGLAGRNIDIIFGFDGESQVVSKIPFDPEYITTLTLGDGTRYTGKNAKIALTRTSVPNDWFNIKVNIASSENTNNAVLQKRYNDYLPYKTPGQKRNPFVKNSMEFVNCVVFIKERDPDLTTHREFNDNNWHFYAMGNIGDSKKTDNTRVNDPSDMNEFVVEISDNTLPNSTFSTGVYLDENGNITYDPKQRVSDVYPISQSQWFNENNLKRKSLYEDWDGSFEFRYDATGTKDGESMSGDEVEALQSRLKQVFRDMYEFVITSSDSDFVNHFGDWFITESYLYWYLFTERYTMIDNRAKNSFWHWGKTYITEADAVRMGDDAENYTINDAAAAINNGYRFDLWNYDDDTAIGIDNNGELNMTFGHEDIDYKTDGDPASGYIFNGADSVIWRRIRQLMNRQLRTMYTSRESLNCWSATSLIAEFDNWQNQFPEELWRIDIERKYLRPYYVGNPVSDMPASQDFLENMMNGRKRYQRRQFERDQEIYIGTKYFGMNQCSDSKAINFRCNTPQTAVVRPDYTLRIVPYSDMYLSVAYGNTSPQTIRAKGGQEYTFTTELTTMDDTIILVYCGENIQALNDLSACYIRANDFSSASRLKTLVIGSTVPGYANPFMTTLSIKDNKLLETLDLRNCTSLTGSLNFSGCVNLENLYAENTKLTGVTFARNGKIKLAHLPETLTSLTLNNLRYLSDLQIAGYDRMMTLVSEYCTLDPLSILNAAIDTLQIVKILGIEWTFNSTELLNKIYAMSSSMLAGTVTINGPVRQQELNNYAAAWPELELTYSGELVPQYYVYFVNDDGSELYRMLVDRGSVAYDPIAAGLIPTPVKESTGQYDFTFDGWDNLPGTIVGEKIVTARYTSAVRSYTVEWYWHRSDTEPAQTKTVQYGREAQYTGERPVDTSGEATLNYRLWSGWDKSTGSVKENLKVYATWSTCDGLPQVGTDMNDMGPAELYAISTARMAGTYFDLKDTKDIIFGSDFDFDNVQSEILMQNEYFNGTKYVTKDIKLFSADSPAYTIALDFEFLSTNANGATLLSCCDSSKTYEGFRLYYAGGPKMSWLGSSAVAAGSTAERNILVMRHVKGSANVLLYVFNVGSYVTYDNEISIIEIPGNSLPTTEEKLVFGGLKYGNSFEAGAKGWVHWCKIWYDDLGEQVCEKLASFPHISHRVEYCGTGINARADGNGRATLTFISNQTFPLYHPMSTNNAAHGWAESGLRSFYNGRLFNGLSYEWQSAIKLVAMKSLEASASSAIITTNDYLYAPALADLGILTTTDPYSSELSNSDAGQISYYTEDLSRMKYPVPMEDRNGSTPGKQVIISQSDPTSLSRYTIEQGDMWRKTLTSVAYMYLSADYASKHSAVGRFDISNPGTIFGNDATLKASDGGVWVMPCEWWTRTPVHEETYSTDYYFNIMPQGGNDYQSPRSSLGMVIGFSI